MLKINTVVWLKRIAYVATVISIFTVGGLLIIVGFNLYEAVRALWELSEMEAYT